VCRLAMLRHVTGAALAAWGLSGLGWLGLAAFAAWSSLGDAGIGPICRASRGALDDVLRPELLLGTTLMVLAMMGPLTAGPMHHLWHRSLARHRLRAIGLFWLVYIALWSLVGVLFALALAAANASRIGNAVLLLLTLLIALAWQLAPPRTSALRHCHLRPPLAVFGVRAVLDPVSFALRLGFWCFAACGAVMLATIAVQNAAPGLGLVPMLIASVLIVWEQVWRAPPRPADVSRNSRRRVLGSPVPCRHYRRAAAPASRSAAPDDAATIHPVSDTSRLSSLNGSSG
jgi:hypothetical protein